jgi:hypothetical protein
MAPTFDVDAIQIGAPAIMITDADAEVSVSAAATMER